MNLLFDQITLLSIIGTSVIGIAAGMLGVFATLRGHSLLGDALSHAAFPGIVGTYLLTHTKHPLVLLSGGAATALLGVFLIQRIVMHTSLKKDAALGIVLSVFFGCGLVCMTAIQKIASVNQSVLNKYVYGNVASLFWEDVCVMTCVSVLAIIVLFLFKKEFTIVAFDQQYASVLGYSVQRVDMLIMGLLVMIVLIGLQSMGVILISSLLIAPAAAARQWTHSIGTMLVLSALFGCVSCVVGSLVSISYERVPTGPVIVIFLTSIVFISLLFSPKRGILKT